MDPDRILLLTAIIIVLVMLFLALLWYVMARGFQRAGSGLEILVGRFCACTPPQGEAFSNQTIRINDIWYKNCAGIIVSTSGLYISVSIPFPGIPGGIALIPWDTITTEGQEQAFWKTYTRIRIAGDEPLSITIPVEPVRLFPKP